MSSCNLMLVSRCLRCFGQKENARENRQSRNCLLCVNLSTCTAIFLGIFQCDLAEIKFDPVASASCRTITPGLKLEYHIQSSTASNGAI